MQGVEELHSFNNLCTGYKATENTFNNHHLLKGLLEVRRTLCDYMQAAGRTEAMPSYQVEAWQKLLFM